MDEFEDKSEEPLYHIFMVIFPCLAQGPKDQRTKEPSTLDLYPKYHALTLAKWDELFVMRIRYVWIPFQGQYYVSAYSS